MPSMRTWLLLGTIITLCCGADPATGADTPQVDPQLSQLTQDVDPAALRARVRSHPTYRLLAAKRRLLTAADIGMEADLLGAMARERLLARLDKKHESRLGLAGMGRTWSLLENISPSIADELLLYSRELSLPDAAAIVAAASATASEPTTP